MNSVDLDLIRRRRAALNGTGPSGTVWQGHTAYSFLPKWRVGQSSLTRTPDAIDAIYATLVETGHDWQVDGCDDTQTCLRCGWYQTQIDREDGVATPPRVCAGKLEQGDLCIQCGKKAAVVFLGTGSRYLAERRCLACRHNWISPERVLEVKPDRVSRRLAVMREEVAKLDKEIFRTAAWDAFDEDGDLVRKRDELVSQLRECEARAGISQIERPRSNLFADAARKLFDSSLADNGPVLGLDTAKPDAEETAVIVTRFAENIRALGLDDLRVQSYRPAPPVRLTADEVAIDPPELVEALANMGKHRREALVYAGYITENGKKIVNYEGFRQAVKNYKEIDRQIKDYNEFVFGVSA